jgi:hypothetical protein
MGVAFDNTCVLWQPLTCSEASGSCLFYDSKALSTNFVILLTSVMCISLIAMIVTNIMYRPADIVSELEVNCDVDDGNKNGQIEAVKLNGGCDDKTKACAMNAVSGVEEKSVVDPSGIINLSFPRDGDAMVL